MTEMSQCPWVTVQYDKFLYHLQTLKFYLLSVHRCHLYIQQTRAVPGQIPGELHLAPIFNQNTVHLTQLFAAYHTTSFQSIAKHFPRTHVLVISKLVFYEELYQMLSENLNKQHQLGIHYVNG